MLIILFGLPGSGKTFVGNILEKEFNFFFYDGDTDLTPEMKKAIKGKVTFTDSMRDAFFKRVTTHVALLSRQYKNLVVSQTFIKEKYRKRFLNYFPFAHFILIETETLLREQRLEARNEYPLDKEYARTMCFNFEEPRIPHSTLNNDMNGNESIINQLKAIILK